jgi:N-sulfoglucosamine sulfohydrolase
MNIVYIHTHDSGRYIQPYGYNIPTPNLMRLAEHGTIFRNAFCAGPTCSPSRAGLLTGMCAHSSGMLGLSHLGFRLDDYNQHLVRFLKSKGYETALSGIQHEAIETEEIGYERVLLCTSDTKEEGGIQDKKGFDIGNAELAVEYIKEKKDRLFFLSFGLVNTHREFPSMDEDAKREINPNFVIPPYPMYDNKKNRQDMAEYIFSAKVADDCIGRVLQALEEAELEDNTIIIFTTDHGIPFPKMKCNLYDSGIGVALLMKYPGNPMKGKAVDELVSQVDLFPTLCDMLELEKPSWLQGFSLVPLLEGKTDKVRSEIFSEVNYHVTYEPMRCVRTERYKLIKYFGEHESYMPENMDGGISKDFYEENGFFKEGRAKQELYDLYMDPVERVNLVDDKRYSNVYEDLDCRLNRWMEQTKDPLLYGKVKEHEVSKV